MMTTKPFAISKRLVWEAYKRVMRKYKRLRGHRRRAKQWLAQQAQRRRGLFPHWQAGFVVSAGTMGAR
jgi:hypothetical protein